MSDGTCLIVNTSQADKASIEVGFRYPKLRHIGAIFLGLLFYWYVYHAIHKGITFKVNIDSWDYYLWGESYFIKFLAELLCVYLTGLITGAISRKGSFLIGLAPMIPPVLIKLLFLYSHVSHTYNPLIEEYKGISIGNKLFIIISLFSMPFIVLKGFEKGKELVILYSVAFDRKRYSVLGIRIYHMVWLPIILHTLIGQWIQHGVFSVNNLMICWSLIVQFKLSFWVTILVIIGLLPTLLLSASIFMGLVKLINIDQERGLKRIFNVCLFLIVCPSIISYSQLLEPKFIKILVSLL